MSEYFVQIDNIYNPNILFEKANTIYNITRERANLVTDNKNKLQNFHLKVKLFIKIKNIDI